LRKINFFITGAARSGTTTMYEVLAGHPDVYMSTPVKEPAYFTNCYGSKQFKEYDNYMKLFSGAKGEKVIGDASTVYLYSEDAAENILKYNPQARIHIQLREPVSRLLSHYRRQVRLGDEKLDLAGALEKEDERIANNAAASYHYYNRGLYYEQVKRFLDIFGRDQVLITLFDDFVQSPSELLKEICLFLEIDKSFIPDEIEQINAGHSVKYDWVNSLLRGDGGLKRILKSFISPKSRKYISYKLKSQWNISDRKVEVSVTPELLARLKQDYRDNILKLQKLIDRDLSNWISTSDDTADRSFSKRSAESNGC
jgi:hypothetical protein